MKDLIRLAKEFAFRKFSEACIENHFFDVFLILQSDFKVKNQDILIAGLLHDTLEDTPTTFDEIKNLFNRKVANLVQEVSHPQNYTQEQRVQYYKYLKTISPEAKLIKMADFTSHLRNFIKIYEKREQRLYPKFVNNDKYISQIRDFLDSCEDIKEKKLVYELTNKLEHFL